MCVPKIKVNHGGSTLTYHLPSQPLPHPRSYITPIPIDVPSHFDVEKVVDDPCIDLVDIVETTSTVTGGSNDEEIECKRCDGATSRMGCDEEDFLPLDQDFHVSSGALSPSLNVVDEEEFEGMGGLFSEDDIDDLEVLVAEYDGELSSPMNFMKPIENVQEDNLPTMLEVFQEDAFHDIEEQCNQVWLDLIDGTNMVPKEVDYTDETRELIDAMPTIETFEVFPDDLLLDLEKEMEQCTQESIWDGVLGDTTNSSPY